MLQQSTNISEKEINEWDLKEKNKLDGVHNDVVFQIKHSEQRNHIHSSIETHAFSYKLQTCIKALKQDIT